MQKRKEKWTGREPARPLHYLFGSRSVFGGRKASTEKKVEAQSSPFVAMMMWRRAAEQDSSSKPEGAENESRLADREAQKAKEGITV